MRFMCNSTTSRLSSKKFKRSNRHCRISIMSAIPHGAFMAKKLAENERKLPKEKISFCHDSMELNPVQYNSKMMNSIWGLYNRYSVHNLKKIWDERIVFGTMIQQLKSVGGTPSGAKGVLLTQWDQLQAVIGYPH